MTNEPHPTPRPQDPFTSQDGARLFNEISKELRNISGLVSAMQGTLANILNKEITTLEQLSRIEAGLSGSRIGRLEQEVKEAELELERAEASRKAAEEKLKLKSEIKENNVDTQEKLQRIASTQYENLEKQRRAERDSKIADLKFSVLKAVVTWGAVGLVTLLFGFIWFLIQLYINRGGP